MRGFRTGFPRQNLTRVSGKIGDLYKQSRNLKKAGLYYKKALATTEKAMKLFADKASRQFYGIALSKLAEISEELGDMKAARDSYQKYYEISMQIANEEKTADACFNLAVAAHKLGYLGGKKDIQKLTEADALFSALAEKIPQVEIYRRYRDLNRRVLKG